MSRVDGGATLSPAAAASGRLAPHTPRLARALVALSLARVDGVPDDVPTADSFAPRAPLSAKGVVAPSPSLVQLVYVTPRLSPLPYIMFSNSNPAPALPFPSQQVPCRDSTFTRTLRRRRTRVTRAACLATVRQCVRCRSRPRPRRRIDDHCPVCARIEGRTRRARRLPTRPPFCTGTGRTQARCGG